MRYKDLKTMNKEHNCLIHRDSGSEDAGNGMASALVASRADFCPSRRPSETPSSSSSVAKSLSSWSSSPSWSPSVANNRRGFTLIEMLVAMSILVVMMGAVGEIFQLAGHAVRVGQATLKTMSDVRAVQTQIASDIQHLDRGGYLIVRQGFYAPIWTIGQVYQAGDEVTKAGTYPVSTVYFCIKGNTASSGNQPGSAGGTPLWASYAAAASAAPALLWRDDQLGFVANGSFHSRTGNNSSSPLTDFVSSNAAAIWYGQLYVSQGKLANGTAEPYYWPQATVLPSNAPPSGLTAGQFYLGRHLFLLAPGSTAGYTAPITDPAFANITYPGTGTPAPGTPGGYGESAAQATSSRFDVALISQSAVEQAAGNLALQTAADNYCYRFAAVASPQASTQGGPGSVLAALNGYFRMTPIMLQGVASFAVDVGYPNALGQLQWYGPDANSLTTNPNAAAYPGWSAAAISETADNYDTQTLVFTQANKQYWPVALKITYLVTDPNNRMSAQTITQIINFPQ